MKGFLDQCELLGLQTIKMHTIGQANNEALNKLILWTKPKTIMPVHTENA